MHPYQAALEAAREGVLLHEQGAVTYVNPSAERILGIRRERVAGRPLIVALRDHRLEALALEGGEGTLEVRGRVLEVRAVPGVLLLWDVTEVHRRLEDLEAARHALAHEFRTPVAGMAALLEALEGGLSAEEAAEVRRLLRAEVDRLARLVEGVDFMAPQREPCFPLAELKPRLERFLSGMLKARGARLVWDAPHRVRADPDAVYQVLLNLVENALKYGPPGEVLVVSEPYEGGLRLEVRDYGAPLEEYKGLFQPGRRGVHAASVRGSGLGLALVRRVARGWGGEAYGRAWAEGNAFGVTFPPERVG
ncbi:sensor histidine kinase [Marinithermus hydrothermalis]|uniref:histidine kinase n=1 Tax=Marinithermus hydrothermalis (strain DSM 14884 / JCM 11576 / T1) TaxID=869210 RepID=F2NNW7_MARHT|nr:ATP-binding protein [Marinithermus hydrothermalis]AEB11341.1 PAS/PAC sensor signal transduction histidine kinase [Marinithermus hydrothermalis DSM 14884]